MWFPIGLLTKLPLKSLYLLAYPSQTVDLTVKPLFLCRFSEWVERCLYTLSDDLGSLAVYKAGENVAGNLTRVLAHIRKLKRALLATFETALASRPKAVILQSGVHYLVHQASSPACFVIPLPPRKRWSSIKAQ